MGVGHGNLKIELGDCGIEYFFNSFLCGLGGVLLLILRFWEILVSRNFCLLVQRC